MSSSIKLRSRERRDCTKPAMRTGIIILQAAMPGRKAAGAEGNGAIRESRRHDSDLRFDYI